jgi:hypothetical protein
LAGLAVILPCIYCQKVILVSGPEGKRIKKMMGGKGNLMLIFSVSVLGISNFASGQQVQWPPYHSARQAPGVAGDLGMQTQELSPAKTGEMFLPEFVNNINFRITTRR